MEDITLRNFLLLIFSFILGYFLSELLINYRNKKKEKKKMEKKLIDEYQDILEVTDDELEAYCKKEIKHFDFVDEILKEERIITNGTMVERVKTLHKEVAAEFNIYDEEYVKFLLSLNETQLTQYENFIHKIF